MGLADVKEVWAAGHFAHLSKVRDADLEPVCPDSLDVQAVQFRITESENYVGWKRP